MRFDLARHTNLVTDSRVCMGINTQLTVRGIRKESTQ